MHIELVHRITFNEEESEIVSNFDQLITTMSELTRVGENEELEETLRLLTCGLRGLKRVIVMD